jgi:hypothetical protein
MVEHISIEHYSAVIQDYIFDNTGKRVKIVFDNPFLMHRHFQLLCKAFDYIQQKHEKQVI